MANDYDGWELTDRQLGRGGQGTVHLARRPERAEQLRKACDALTHDLNDMRGGQYDSARFAKLVVELGSQDMLEHLAALKVFDIPPGNSEEETKAVGRLEAEMRALANLKHPSILRLLHGNSRKRFIVVEYHPNGPLDKHLSRYRGATLTALEAFRPLVDGVAGIHEQGAIHRDIKPENIFIATDGRLVLGDFGIVIFKDGPGQRLTTTYEKVGTSFWMAPWAYKNERLAMEDITPSLDIFPLAKVLWSLISGRNGFPYWELDRAENNLERIFPDDPMMTRVNHLLSKCIVREESDCAPSARQLLAEVDKLIELARRVGQRPDDGGPWPCRMCRRGEYRERDLLISAYVSNTSNRAPFRVYVCDLCGHTEMFT